MATLKKRLETIIRHRQDEPGEGDLLAGMLRARDSRTGAGLSTETLRDELMMMLVMGHMPTAMALTWTWSLLATHPQVRLRLEKELDSRLAGRPPGPEDLEQLVFTRQVIDEVLRLYPSTWSFARRAVADDVVGGFPIAAGSILMLSPYVTHRRKDLWPEPERFDPDRFASGQAQKRHRFAYFPFGGGPRSCIANNFASLEVPLLIARLAQTFRLDLAEEGAVPIHASITLEPRGGLSMLPRLRQEE